MMDNPPRPSQKSTLPPGQAPQARSIGNFRLLEKAGEGGMGEVYRAEQFKPVRRQVAVKLIKLGMDSKQVVARFESERQALALMDHPHIAKVIDGGTSESGRPYFAMEWVQGIPITEYCDRFKLSIGERLGLFMLVCDGVQHAHLKGVIHRDLKPSNVLIAVHDAAPLPKIIDFGVAKAIAGSLTDKTLRTQLGQFIGTPEYMSPEQAEMSSLDIDTRTDVYSLGVLLYELVVGERPFTLKSTDPQSLETIRRRILEEEPQRPSTRIRSLGDTLSEHASMRKLTPQQFHRSVHGDLDRIILKALEKDRTRRYATPNELTQDVGRFLKHEPVLASPPSLRYRVRKFVRRNRILVGASAVVVATLALGVVGTTAALLRANRAQRAEAHQRAVADRQKLLAQQQADAAEAVVQFLNQDLLGAADPHLNEGREITVREALDAASQKIDGAFEEQPRVEAQVRYTLGKTYRTLGLLESSSQHLDAGARRLEAVPGTELLRAQLLEESALAHSRAKENQRALELAKEVIRLRQQVLPEGAPEIMRAMGDVAMYEALANGEVAAGMTDWTLAMMANVRNKGETKEQLRDLLYQRQLETERLWASGEHQAAKNVILHEASAFLENPILRNRLPWTMAAYGKRLLDSGFPNAGEAVIELGLELGDVDPGPNHEKTLLAASYLGTIRRNQQRFAEADTLYRRVYDTYMQVYGEDHPDTKGAVRAMVKLFEAWEEPDSTDKYQAILDRLEQQSPARSSQ